MKTLMALLFLTGCATSSMKKVPTIFSSPTEEVSETKEVSIKKEEETPKSESVSSFIKKQDQKEREKKEIDKPLETKTEAPFKKGDSSLFDVVLRGFVVGKASLKVVDVSSGTMSFVFEVDSTGIISKFYTLKLKQESQTDLNLNTIKFLSYSLENSKERLTQDEYDYKTRKVKSTYNDKTREIDFPEEEFRDTLSALFFLRWKGEEIKGRSLLDGSFVSYEIKKTKDSLGTKFSIVLDKKGTQYIWLNENKEIVKIQLGTSAGNVVLTRKN